MVPMYIKYMGAEAYGLVGFFAMLQAWFNLLDMGLTPTMARESARFHGGAISAMEYRRLARTLEGVFLAVALLGGLLLFALSDLVAEHWLNASDLPVAEITASLQLMAVIVALRWMCGLYRGVIMGAEKLHWLSGLNSAVATLRFVAVMPVLVYVSASPLAFFGFQLGVAVLELATVASISYRLLPYIPTGERIRWEWAPLKPVLKFSLTIAFTSSIWVLVTQTDKLVLSKILPLSEYGYFTVAVLMASGIMIFSGPISSAIMPRMTRLQAEDKHEQLLVVYRKGTQLVTVICIPVLLLLTCFSRQVLWVWTGDLVLVEKSSTALTLYAAGYGVLAVCAFPYYLQYAKGDLKLHLIGNLLVLITLIPSVVWAGLNYGLVGTGWAWLLAHSLYLLIWIPYVHQRISPGLHLIWLSRDVILPVVLPTVFALAMAEFFTWSDSRVFQGLEIGILGVLLFTLALPHATLVRFACRGHRFAV